MAKCVSASLPLLLPFLSLILESHSHLVADALPNMALIRPPVMPLLYVFTPPHTGTQCNKQCPFLELSFQLFSPFFLAFFLVANAPPSSLHISDTTRVLPLACMCAVVVFALFGALPSSPGLPTLVIKGMHAPSPQPKATRPCPRHRCLHVPHPTKQMPETCTPTSHHFTSLHPTSLISFPPAVFAPTPPLLPMSAFMILASSLRCSLLAALWPR